MSDIYSSDPASGPSADLIIDGDTQSFMDDVVEASKSVPVIVDFWADWCGPCRQLTPALEQAVRDAGGAVRLVKIDADKNQTLCGQLQIQSLPTVMAFFQGQPVDGFQGAVPPSQLKQFIDRLSGLGDGAADDPVKQALEQADQLVQSGDWQTAGQIYQQIRAHVPDNLEALIGLAECEQAGGNLDAVADLIGDLDPLDMTDADLKEKLRRLQAALELRSVGDSDVDTSALEARIEADPQDHAARYELAEAHQANGDREAAAEALLASIMRDRDWNEGAARELLVKMFDAAGPKDPFTLKYRRRLSSVLFS